MTLSLKWIFCKTRSIIKTKVKILHLHTPYFFKFFEFLLFSYLACLQWIFALTLNATFFSLSATQRLQWSSFLCILKTISWNKQLAVQLKVYCPRFRVSFKLKDLFKSLKVFILTRTGYHYCILATPHHKIHQELRSTDTNQNFNVVVTVDCFHPDVSLSNAHFAHRNMGNVQVLKHLCVGGSATTPQL